MSRIANSNKFITRNFRSFYDNYTVIHKKHKHIGFESILKYNLVKQLNHLQWEKSDPIRFI